MENKIKYYNYIKSKQSYKHSIVLVLVNIYWIIVRFILLFLKKRNNRVNKCDILVIGITDIDIIHSINVWNSLRNLGYNVVTKVVRKKEIYTSPFFYNDVFKYAKELPITLRFYSIYTRYLISIYQPSVICSFFACGLIPSLFRENMKGKGKLIFIPHAMISSDYLYTNIDYDYYFVFGRSSLNNLRMNENRYCSASTKVVLTGSPMIKPDFVLAPNYLKKTILYLSNWQIGINKEVTDNFNNIVLWAKNNPQYELIIKLHPNEDKEYIKQNTGSIDNIKVLPKETSIKQALIMASLVIVTSGSSSGIEATLMNRPIVMMNIRKINENSIDYRDSDKQYMTEHFFIERARNANELEDRINVMFENFDYYLSKCQDYVSYHLANQNNSQEVIVNTIKQIINNKEEFNYELIEPLKIYKN